MIFAYIFKMYILKRFTVNEEGSEAAAATTAVMVPLCGGCGPKRKIFKADRPFTFLIRESKTGMVLFSGRVVDPNKM